MITSSLAVAFQLGPLTVRWYGIINCLAMVLAIFVACQEVKREHLDTEELLNIALLIIPVGVIGARIYYIIMHWPYYSQNLVELPMIWKGGLAIHGGMFLGIIAILIYCRKRKMSFLRWADMIVLGMILAQVIGRWGNYVNAELYGPVIEPGSTWSWVPFQVFANGAYHHPTFFYESVWDLLGFILLTVLIRREHRVGAIFSVYLMFTSFGRFFIELIRTDMLMLFGVRQCYTTCPIMFVSGLLILLVIRRNPKVDVCHLPDGQKKGQPKGKKQGRK